MAVPVTEFDDVEYLRRVVVHLYELLDDIDTADDVAKSDDVAYRKIVGGLQAKKRDSGVSSPDGYCLHIEPREFQTKDGIPERLGVKK